MTVITRRQFANGFGGAALWPIASHAQQGERMRRIGVLVPYDESDPVLKPRISALTQALADLGWTDGRNVRMDLRWHGGGINRIRAFSQELFGLQPDIILTSDTAATVAVQREQDRQGARPYRASIHSVARRRGDRVKATSALRLCECRKRRM